MLLLPFFIVLLDFLIILGIREDILRICAIQKKLFLVSYI